MPLGGGAHGGTHLLSCSDLSCVVGQRSSAQGKKILESVTDKIKQEQEHDPELKNVENKGLILIVYPLGRTGGKLQQ